VASIRVGLCLDVDAPAQEAGARRLSGSDIIVFPEMADSGYAALKAGALPHLPGDPLLKTFARYSETLAPYCIAGSIYFGSPFPTNTSLVFHGGRRIHRYDKVHLFRPAGDHRYFAPGTILRTFSARIRGELLHCGVIICYDLRFPELVRILATRGLDILFVPARWPALRDEAWRTLLKARAIENQIFVVGCNALGKEGGASYVFDPLGETVLSTPPEGPERTHTADLNMGKIAEAHKLHRSLDEAVVLRSLRLPSGVTARRRPGTRRP
jgi:omega-amidase